MQLVNGQSEEEGRLILDGEITLLCAEELLALIKQALEKETRVIVDVSQTEDIDAACLQLLCAAHRTADGAGKELRLSTIRSDNFAARVGQTGLHPWPGCRYSRSSSCLWIGGA